MLRFRIPNKARPLSKAEGRHNGGPQQRIDKLRKLVTALIRHERIEGRIHYIDEARGYTERLLQMAAKNGDQHNPTMELADYWLLEKDLVHKLFKVLVPRYTNYDGAFTTTHRLPYTDGVKPNMCIELKGNPWPPIVFKTRDVRGSLLNVLLDEAKKEYRQAKYEEIASNGNFHTPVNHEQTENKEAVMKNVLSDSGVETSNNELKSP